MDTSRKIREIAIQDITDIGKLAFEYADAYIRQGESQKGNEYKLFSIGVLMLAFEYDKSRKDIAMVISGFADKFGDKEAAGKYRTLGGQ